MQARIKTYFATAMLLLCASAGAATTVQLHLVDDKGVGKQVGEIVISETPYGVLFTPSLAGLPPGLHGFHVHENANCEAGEKDGKKVPALAAGGHFDPSGSKRHGEPWGDGHLGDLPGLYVDGAGNASYPVLAPRLKLNDLSNRSLVLHAGGDNHADHPVALGGAGARLACGIIR